MKNKKKIIVLSCMIALLAVTAVFNFILTTEPSGTESAAVVTSANYFTQYRTERLTKRNEEMLQLDAVITSANAQSADISEALDLKVRLTSLTERELYLESLIKAYGFEDVVVVMGLDTENVNVIAKSSDLSADDAVLIYTIIREENIASPENVKIIPIS